MICSDKLEEKAEFLNEMVANVFFVLLACTQNYEELFQRRLHGENWTNGKFHLNVMADHHWKA